MDTNSTKLAHLQADITHTPAQASDIPSAASIATAIGASIVSGSTSVATVLAGFIGWTVGQVTGYATGQVPAKTGDAMTLTSAYDAAKTAASQASVDAIPTTGSGGGITEDGVVTALGTYGTAKLSDITTAEETLADAISAIPPVRGR